MVIEVSRKRHTKKRLGFFCSFKYLLTIKLDVTIIKKRSVKGVTHNILLMQKEKINEQVNKNGNEVLVPSGKEQKK